MCRILDPMTNDTVAVLLNDGNLVLRSSSNSFAVFWQSFDYPTNPLIYLFYYTLNKH